MSTAKMWWDGAENFQGKISGEDPSGKEGFEGFLKIRRILEPHWDSNGSGRHPLRSKFYVASEPNYKWLSHFARKLERLEKVIGSDEPIARLGVPEEYSGAWAELDFALRLHLAGISCEFVPRTSEPTPDMWCEIKGEKVDIEVTSLAAPDVEMVSLWIMGEITGHLFQQRCLGGGLFGREPNQGEARQLLGLVVDAAKRAKLNHRKETVNVPGLLACHIVPDDMASAMPQEWLGHFEMSTRTRPPIEDKLRSKIDEKAMRQLSQSKTAVLVVHNRYSSQDEMVKLSNNRDVGIKIGTFPNLAGTILIQFFVSYDPFSPTFTSNGSTIFLEHNLLDGEAERCAVWSNPMGGNLRTFLDPLIECQKNLPVNLTQIT